MMEYTFSTAGALIGLAIAVVLIVKKLHPVYSLIFGALIGGIIGGGGLEGTVSAMVTGAQGMMSSVIRIMTSGILAGALIRTGSTEKIADTIVTKLGEKRAVAAISIATMIICAVGVFIDISVITVAPIALAIAKRAGLSKSGVLLAMIGGGKAGNIISPNPNTIAASEAFDVDLTALMMKNLIPALCALVVTIILSTILSKKKGERIVDQDIKPLEDHKLPGFLQAICGPVFVIVLLVLRPIAGISVDPLIALPLGGFLSIIMTANIKKTIAITEFGLSKVIGVSILLIGTGTIAGIIKASALQQDVIKFLEAMNMPAFVLAPIAGILMAAATASTTAGASIASQTFAPTLIEQGILPIAAAATVHAGATVLDSLPHGSFFHATGGAVNMSIKERMKIIPYEVLVGITSTIAAVIVYVVMGK